MATVTAQWAEFNGVRFEKYDDVIMLEARETPKMYFVIIPKDGNVGGAIIRLRKFTRRSGEKLTSWRHYYGFVDKKYIEFKLVAPCA